MAKSESFSKLWERSLSFSVSDPESLPLGEFEETREVIEVIEGDDFLEGEGTHLRAREFDVLVGELEISLVSKVPERLEEKPCGGEEEIGAEAKM